MPTAAILAQLAESWRTRSRSTRPLANARRSAGLAHNDTEESLGAACWPRAGPPPPFCPVCQRLSSPTCAALRKALPPYRPGWRVVVEAVRPCRAGWTCSTGAWPGLRSRPALRPRRRPGPSPVRANCRPAIPDRIPTQDHPGERLLERLERQAEVLYRHPQFPARSRLAPRRKAILKRNWPFRTLADLRPRH